MFCVPNPSFVCLTLICPPLQAENHVHGVSEEALQAALKVQFDELIMDGRANKIEIIENVLEVEDRLAAMMAERDARIMEEIHAMYKLVEPKSKTTKSANTGASIDLDSLKLVKGKKGKLGRGSHGVVKLAYYQPDGGGEPRKVAIKMVPVDEPDAQAALQVRPLFSYRRVFTTSAARTDVTNVTDNTITITITTATSTHFHATRSAS